ncbi:growth/differentiation factor 15 [Sorex fumeus]|uniref:growth/differentiation factor 15 n=1 Tax=Sorex fumeus TaxID=62283 RepID=UPI0024AD52E9|nr:growth/differentiation factor 15 [Sorex fumeus]
MALMEVSQQQKALQDLAQHAAELARRGGWKTSSLLLLQFWLLLPRLPAGGALELPRHDLHVLRVPPGPPDLRVRELRKRYENLQRQLWENQTRDALNPDAIPDVQVRLLSSKPRLGPDSHLYQRIPRSALTEGVPASSRLHLALLRLAPTAPTSWDVTRLLRQQLGSGAPGRSVLHLRLPPPSSDRWRRGAQRSVRPQLELHWRPAASRGRRSTQELGEDRCPLGAGRCCRLVSLRASLQDLGWADWVVAPQELDVRMCIGACPTQFRSAKAHTQMQARLHRLRPDSVPEPCCVPSKYDPVVLMHRDNLGHIALTPFDDLVAADCHCA